MAKAAKVAAPKKEEETKAIVPVLKAGALSTDVGPFVVKNWATSIADTEKGEELIASANKKRYDLNAKLTLAIVKAAKADKSIDLTATTKMGPEGTKAMSLLNDQLYLALGIKVAVKKGKGDKQAETLVYAPSVASYFPARGESEEAARPKKTLRSNLSHTLKKCSQAALAVIERGITAKYDTAEGTLLLSGPSIKKDFGVDKVHLNEKQKVPGKKEGETIELKEKPSFTAIADMAARDHGTALRRGSNTRGKNAVGGDKKGSGASLINPLDALKQMSASVIKICESFKKTPPSDEQRKLLEAMADAIDAVVS